MDRQGQGAIEYLLIIGAAILVVAVVIIALTSVTSGATNATDENAVQGAMDPLCKSQCESLDSTNDFNELGCFDTDGNVVPLSGNCGN
jgi:hypothetical protein